jgi:adenosylmethionine-8-amino-7-oxononanoate aminotransferase
MVKSFEDKGEEFQSLYTYSAHPLSCAIGAKVQEIIDREGLVARAERMGNYLGKRLEALREIPEVGDVRGKGLLWAVELVKDQKTREPFPREANMKMKVCLLGAVRGVLFYPGYYRDANGRGDHIMLAPPYIITEEQIDEMVDALAAAIKDAVKAK